MSTITVIGSYNQDFIWNTQHFPSPGETTTGTFSSSSGGKGSNQAIAAARTGAKTNFIGAVGEDDLAKQAQALHEKEKINAHLIKKTNSPTGTAAIWVDSSGQNQIVGALGANLDLAIEDIPLKVIEDSQIVIGQPEANPNTILQALKHAKASGALTILNPAPVPPDFNLELLEVADISIPNEIEFSSIVQLHKRADQPNFSESDLLNLNHSELHEICRTISSKTFIITLGKKGCFISTPEKFEYIDAHKNITAVDTTGAGDAFIGGFASGMIQFQRNILQAAKYASAVAALAVTKKGAASGMPHKEEIEQFLNNL